MVGISHDNYIGVVITLLHMYEVPSNTNNLSENPYPFRIKVPP